MAMTAEKFEALIKRLEVYAREHPAGYKLRVALLDLLGYAYIFAVLAGALLLFGLLLLLIALPGSILVLVNGGWIILVFVGITLRALWVRFPKPSGIELSYEDAPRLFDLIGELATALQAPSIRHIFLTSDNNASIIQRPRLGVFGWHANYLVLGLPLMQTLLYGT